MAVIKSLIMTFVPRLCYNVGDVLLGWAVYTTIFNGLYEYWMQHTQVNFSSDSLQDRFQQHASKIHGRQKSFGSSLLGQLDCHELCTYASTSA